MSTRIINEDENSNDIKIQFYFGDINVTDIFAYAKGIRIYLEENEAYVILNRSLYYEYKHIDDFRLWDEIMSEEKNIPEDKRWSKIENFFNQKLEKDN